MIAIKAMSVEETYSILIMASTAKNQTWIKPENKDEDGVWEDLKSWEQVKKSWSDVWLDVWPDVGSDAKETRQIKFVLSNSVQWVGDEGLFQRCFRFNISI